MTRMPSNVMPHDAEVRREQATGFFFVFEVESLEETQKKSDIRF